MAASDQLIEKILNDNDFASQLLNDPEAALRGVGVEPTAEIVNALRGLDAQGLQSMASTFSQQGAAAASS